MRAQKIYRRKLDDPATIDSVVSALKSMEELHRPECVGIIHAKVIPRLGCSMLEVTCTVIVSEAA